MSAGATSLAAVLVSRYDPEYAIRAEHTLAIAGLDVEVVDSIKEIRERVFSDSRVTLIVLTGGISERATREFLRQIDDAARPVGVLALVNDAEFERIERRREQGIDEVLKKPFDANELTLVARRLMAREELVGKTHIIGRSEPIKLVLERVSQYAPVHSTVLIEGESGTGKELIARAIHDLSIRASKPFIAVNCAALTESLLESELFGHEKGAFTGATSLRKGHFEIADRGTLLLDEVGEMPLSTQVKLLRVLEEREFMRVGGSTPIRVNVRVLASTNRDLESAVEAGEFRRDLYYRLNVLNVRMPPLRERRDDIPLLIHHFVQEFCTQNDRQFVGITDEAMSVLKNYDWPGNVRELRNLVESMLVLTPGSRIRARDIPEEIYARANPERLLPMPLGEDVVDGGVSGARIEALLGYLYRDLKGELDGLRSDYREIRELLEGGDRGVSWVRAVEVETEGDDIQNEVRTVPISEASNTSEVPTGAEGELLTVGVSLDEIERLAIERTLAAVGGNRRRAAEILGIGERTLYRKLKKYGLS
jgi:DNA-binding NtrC family response regulator